MPQSLYERMQQNGSAPSMPTPRRAGGSLFERMSATETEPVDTTPDEGLDSFLKPAGMAGLAALIGGAALAAKTGNLGKIANKVNSVRQQMMLSGLAIPKTVLGNVGGTAIESIERGSTAPLRELIRPQTAKDFMAALRSPAAQQHVTGGTMPGPGRVLGAIDDATSRALQRAGLTQEEVDRITFQTPLGTWAGKEFTDMLDSPAARYLLPFRRTPFNNFREGFKTLKPENLQTNSQKALMGVTAATGAAHGYGTADEQHPMSLGLAAAASNRYAVPYLLSAAAGRALAGGTDPESVAGEILPVSEYGLASGLTNPAQSFTQPAAVRVLRRLLGEQ